MQEAETTHTMPPTRRRRGTDAEFLEAAAFYRRALDEASGLSAAPVGPSRADVEAHDDRVAAAVQAEFASLQAAAELAADLTTAEGRRARARLFLMALDDAHRAGAELETDCAELMLARAIANDAAAG